MPTEPSTARVRAELDDRTQRTMTLMRAHGLRALIVYSDGGNAGNVRYLTNYRPFFGVSVLILRDDGERVLINTFIWDAPRARVASGLERIESGFDTGALVLQTLDSMGIAADAAVGLVGSTLIPYSLYTAITDGAGRPRPADVQAEYEVLRLIKSPFEQEMLRCAAAITDDAITTAIAEAHEGMSERELAGFIEYQMKRAGADGLAFPAGVAAGPNTERPVSLPSTRQLEAGDLVMIDVGATWEGYNADVTRTCVVGAPSLRQRQVYDAVRRAGETTIAAVRPGIPANQLHQIAVSTLARDGLDQYFTHRVGHGCGLETSLEAPDLQRQELPLQPGMSICIEPGVYIPGFGGMKIEDMVIVGADGPEVISSASKELIAI